MDHEKITGKKKELKEWNLLSSQQVMQRTLLNNIHESIIFARLFYMMGATFCFLAFFIEPLLGLPRSPQYGILLGLFVVISVSEIASDHSLFSAARNFFAKRKFKKLGLDPELIDHADALEDIIQSNELFDRYHQKFRVLNADELHELHQKVLGCNSEWVTDIWKQWLASDKPVRLCDKEKIETSIKYALSYQKSNVGTSQLTAKQKLLNEEDIVIDDEANLRSDQQITKTNKGVI